MIIYVYPKCSTCQKALAFLKTRKIEPTIKDITITPPTIDELKKMLHFQGGNIKKLLNTSGLLYREMQLSHKIPEMTEDQVLSLLTTHGMLVKRPFLLSKDFGLLGFKEAEWDLKLGN